VREEEPHFPKFDYYLDESDPDVPDLAIKSATHERNMRGG
jgi:hypothetical protein